MIELKGSPKEQKVREWLNKSMNGKIPINAKVIDIFRKFEVDHPELSYGLLNSTIKKVIAEGHSYNPKKDSIVNATDISAPEEKIEAEIVNIEDMEFPEFSLHKTGKKLDELFSDHEDGGGLYGGTVNIVVGESGVGKSTVLLDMLASIKKNDPDCKILYVSSEMTRNDILFYYKKTPAIAKVPTLLLMDYVKTGQLDQVLRQTFNDGHHIIVLDSYQDVVVKLKEVQKWKSTFAESWLTNMMIDAAEKQGTAVLAIQHMTKGGKYVGSTYLKHATTAMLEMMFDDAGLRYIMFSKNRRGGSNVNKRLYFTLEKETGNILYDKDRFDETEELRDIENAESIRQVDLSRKFEEVFITGKKNDDSADAGDSIDNASELNIDVDFQPVEEEDED